MNNRTKTISGYTLLLVFSLFILIGSTPTIALQPIPLPAEALANIELLTNAGFEAGSDANGIPNSWIATNTSTSQADKLKCDGATSAHSGLCAFMFKGNSNGSSSDIRQRLTDITKLANGTKVVFSAYIDPRESAAGVIFGRAVITYSNGSTQTLTLAIPAGIMPLLGVPDPSGLVPLTAGGGEARASADYILVQTQQTVSVPAGATISSVIVRVVETATTGTFLVDDSSFAVIPPPPVKLIASDGTDLDLFGYSASLSSDGKLALVAAPFDDIAGKVDQGSAYVFVLSNGVWTQQVRLIASDGAAGDRFGSSVALLGDGTTALVGAPLDSTDAKISHGSAYIFTRSGSSWTQQAKLVASDSAGGDFFGTSVALNFGAFAVTALIGAYNDDIGANANQGSAYVFTRNLGVWTQQIRLIANDGTTSDKFGTSVALNGSSTALVGASNDAIGSNIGQGSAYIFTRSAGVWTQQAKLTASDGATSDSFGETVALSSDGSTALIGARSDDIVGKINQGSAYVFTRSGSFWTQKVKLTASDGAASDNFGDSVAFSSNNNTAVVGASYDTIEGNGRQGSIYIFTSSGGGWKEKVRLVASDGATSDNFGYSVALNSTGSMALVGVPYQDIGGNQNQGSAYVIPIP